MIFDYIIQNPPYKKSLHLEFLKLGVKLLNNQGKLIIIEPSTWLINIRKNGKAELYNEIKKLLNNHVYKVIIENYNAEFDTRQYVPFSITYIDFNKEYKTIDFQCCGEYKKVKSIYDCNLIGEYDIIWNILNKVTGDKIVNHIFKMQKIKNQYYIPYSELCGVSPIGNYAFRPIASISDKNFITTVNGEFHKYYFTTLFHPSYSISNTVPKRIASGGCTSAGIKYQDKDADCITGTKKELENYQYFVFNNRLSLFINIIMSIDQHNNSLKYVPWLVDKKYTDEEIYQLYKFTDNEIELINNTINKFERYSSWFNRYMKGNINFN